MREPDNFFVLITKLIWFMVETPFLIIGAFFELAIESEFIAGFFTYRWLMVIVLFCYVAGCN